MKRTGALLLALILLTSISGCCFAPGYEGSELMEMRFMLPSNWTPTQSAAVTQVTDPEPITLPPEALEAIANLPDRENKDFVSVVDYIPDISVELKYATSDNIAGKAIYDFDTVYLRYGTVVKLMQVQAELREMGLSLKIWDGFRPVSAQFELWAACPNPTFVANPETGYSSHSRGSTVDITIVNAAGEEQEMPTGFDDFTSLADRNYFDCTDTAAANARMLESLMEKYGFTGLQAEWWHYSDETEYDVETVFDPAVISTWYAECNEYINLRVSPEVGADVLAHIPDEEAFTLLGWSGKFAFVEYENQRGYVNGDYIKSSK